MRFLFYAFLLSMCLVSFAVPSGLSLEINSGAEYTKSTTVDLTLSADGAENCSLSNYESFSPNITYAYSSLPTTWDLLNGSSGTRTVYFMCVDVNGSPSGTESDDITLDIAPPSASSKNPASGGTVTSRRPTISAILSDTGGSGIDQSSIVLKLDGGAVSHSYSSGNVSYTPTSDLSLSTHTVNLSVSDNAGNPYSTSWTFTISSTGVGFSSAEPGNGSTTNDGSIEISVVLQDLGGGINSSTITMSLDDESVTEDITYSNSTKKVSYDVNLEDGNHTVVVAAKDNSAVSSSITWSFVIDTTPPAISLFVPSNGSTVTTVYEISAVIEDDDSGVNEDRVFMELNGVDVTRSLDFDESSGRVTFEPAAALGGGTHTVEIWAEDTAGNEKYAKWTFKIPSTAPSFSSETPVPDSTVRNATPEISVAIEDEGTSGIDTSSVKMYLDGSAVNATLSTSTGKLSYKPQHNISNAEHTVRVEAENNQGEKSEINWSFSVDSTGPQPPTGFVANRTENGVSLAWVSSASADVEEYLIYSSSTSFTSVSNKNPLAELDPDETSYAHNQSGKFFYAIVAVDAIGNPSTPAFAGTCAAFAGGSWTEFGCCADGDCPSGEQCNLTVHRCIKPAGSTSAGDAESAIDLADRAIENAQLGGKDTSEAEDLLVQAQNSYNAGNYEDAERLAQLARDAALAAPSGENETAGTTETGDKKKLPCLPSFALLGILGFLAYRLK